MHQNETWIELESEPSSDYDKAAGRQLGVIGLMLGAIGLTIWLSIFSLTTWRTVEAQDIGFSVDMPKAPSRGFDTVSCSVRGDTYRLAFPHQFAQPLRQLFLVGYHDLSKKLLRRSLRRDVLRELIEAEHVVPDYDKFGDMRYLDHELPAAEIVFPIDAWMGATWVFTKRVYVSKDHGRAFVVVHAVHSRESDKPEILEAKERFLSSFRVLPASEAEEDE